MIVAVYWSICKFACIIVIVDFSSVNSLLYLSILCFSWTFFTITLIMFSLWAFLKESSLFRSEELVFLIDGLITADLGILSVIMYSSYFLHKFSMHFSALAGVMTSICNIFSILPTQSWVKSKSHYRRSSFWLILLSWFRMAVFTSDWLVACIDPPAVIPFIKVICPFSAMMLLGFVLDFSIKLVL